MKSEYPFHPVGIALAGFLLQGCACPASYRDVPAPRVQSAADVAKLSRCQVQHYGTTLLGQAGSAAVAKALLDRGASVQGRLIVQGKVQSGSPLNLAGSPELIRLLTSAGANPNTQGGPDNSTPLCAALRRGLHDNAAALLSAGADPNLPDAQGEPPLCIAAKRRDARLCGLLLSYGARPNDTSRKDGSTPLLALLRQDGLESHTEEKQNIAQALLAAGANPALADATGTVPLHLAPACLVQTFLSAGANANCRNSAGRTPLFFGGSQERLELLLRYGADIHALDYEGNSAFDTVPEAGLKSYLLIRGCRSGKTL